MPSALGRNTGTSPSTRRAWIEIRATGSRRGKASVALHPEGVDRNQASGGKSVIEYVALHPEGVDRNFLFAPELTLFSVALHPEGVDRNGFDILDQDVEYKVALHPEGVDRNWHRDK